MARVKITLRPMGMRSKIESYINSPRIILEKSVKDEKSEASALLRSLIVKSKRSSWLTWLIGPIVIFAVIGALRYQPVVALPGLARAELDADPIVLILNPLHRHRSSIAARARAYHIHQIHTRLSVRAAR